MSTLLAGLTLAPVRAEPAAGAADTPRLPPAIQKALSDSGLPESALALWVQGVDDPLPRLAWRAQERRSMASVMKLITTGAALRSLGPAWRWKTSLGLGGPIDAQGTLQGDLHVRASGDPALDFDRLMAQMWAMRQSGLKRIAGQVKVDRQRFELPPFDSAAFDGLSLKPYNAGPETWLLAHQAVTLWIQPPRGSGSVSGLPAVQAGLWPPMANVQVVSELRPDARAPCGDWRSAIELVFSSGGGQALAPRTLTLKGPYPLACDVQTWPVRWPSEVPLEHAARVFRAAWSETGGSIDGGVSEAPWPERLPVWLEWPSPPMADVIRDINKFSNNVMARHLFLTLAVEADGLPGTLERARAVVSEQVRSATRQSGMTGPCDGDRLLLDNGSGLSREEGASTACMGRWIQVMWQDPTMPEWLASLPVAGVDGTARRMSAAAGRAHLKTGSLDGVAALAGVVQDEAGRRQIVVAVINDRRAGSQRTLLQAVVNWAAGARP